MVMSKLLSLLVLSDLIKLMKTRTSRKSHIRSYTKAGETWYEITFSLLGNQVRRRGYASYDEAEEDYHRIRSKIRAGEWVNFQSHSLHGATLDELYKVYCQSRGDKRAASTVNNCLKLWNRTVSPILGSIRVRDFSRRNLTMFVRECRLAGLTDNTIQRYAAEINNVLTMAVEYEVLQHPPMWPKLQPTPERKALLSPSEVMTIINCVEQHVSAPQYKLMIKVQYQLALRLGELLALSPGKFDLDAGTVVIDQQKLEGSDFRLGPTKTKTSVVLPLSPSLIEELRPYVEERDNNAPLWISLQLRPVSRNSYIYVLKTAVKKAGIQKKITSHCLRASCLDYLVNKTSLSIMQVAYYARHSPQVLVSRYAGSDTAGLMEFFSSKNTLSDDLNCDTLAEGSSMIPEVLDIDMDN
jgi:integrase